MAQLFEIKKVTVGPKNLDAIVELAPNAPVMTHEDLEGTTRVWEVMPQLRDHVCLGDESGNFGEVMGSTELAHLLEHVTVELLARTDIAGDIPCGQTAEVGERAYRLTFKCADDVLVVGALSSAAWIMQWAFSGGGEPKPDVDAIAAGLTGLVGSLPEPEPRDEDEIIAGPEPDEAEAEAPQVDEGTEVEAEAEDAATDADSQEERVAEQMSETEPAPAEPTVDEAEVEAILAAEPAVPEPEPAAVPAAEEEAVPVEAYDDIVENSPASDFPGLFVDEEPFEGDPETGEELFEPEANEEVDAEVFSAEPAVEGEATAESETAVEPAVEPVVEPEPEAEAAVEPAPTPAPEPAPVPEPEPVPADDWGMENVPRPRLVR